MSEFIRTMNRADMIGRDWRTGYMPAILAIEELVGMGFYQVEVANGAIIGWLNGTRWTI